MTFIPIFLIVLALIPPPATWAGYKDDVGLSQPGITLPAGSEIIATQVEASSDCNWQPNPTIQTEFWQQGTPKTFSYGTCDPECSAACGVSDHATNVAKYFFGNASSLWNGILSIEVYDAEWWLGADDLHTASPFALPDVSQSRVANHSWVGNSGYAAEILRRMDWVVEKDEFVQVTALNNGSTPKQLPYNMFNAIAAGRTDHIHTPQTSFVDEVYTAGRVRPHIVVPFNRTSYTAPLAASAVGILVQYAHENNSRLSTGFQYNTRLGKDIYNVEASEVIKAAVMAGAERRTDNTHSYPVDSEPFIPNITDYATSGYASPNGLDTRYGAGQLNVFHSLQIIAAGEKEPGVVAAEYGFDYDPTFGGSSDPKTAEYRFSILDDFRRLHVALVWNLKVAAGKTITANTPATLYDLNLALYRWNSDSGNFDLVAASNGTADNTENLYFPHQRYGPQLLMPGDYKLEVAAIGTFATSWDYALAWRATVDPDFDGDSYPNESDAFPYDAEEWLDTDGDGSGNNTDTDDDGDGMPDDWEAQYAPILDPLIDDAYGDPDGDGSVNLAEYQNGTDPTDSQSKIVHVPGPSWALLPTGLVMLLIGTLYQKRTK